MTFLTKIVSKRFKIASEAFKSRYFYASVIAFCFFITSLTSSDPDPRHDGILLVPAIALTKGLTLYNDVYSVYGPLTSWFQGSVAFIFGTDLLVQRYVAFACVLFIARNIYLISKHTASERAAQLVTLLFLATGPYTVSFWPLYMWPSLLLTAVLTGAIRLTSSNLGRSRDECKSVYPKFDLQWLSIGLLVGLALYVRPFSGFVAVSVSVIFAFQFLESRARKPLFAGLSLGASAPIVFLWYKGSTTSFFSQVFGAPAGVYGESIVRTFASSLAELFVVGTSLIGQCSLALFLLKTVVPRKPFAQIISGRSEFKSKKQRLNIFLFILSNGALLAIFRTFVVGGFGDFFWLCVGVLCIELWSSHALWKRYLSADSSGGYSSQKVFALLGKVGLTISLAMLLASSYFFRGPEAGRENLRISSGINPEAGKLSSLSRDAIYGIVLVSLGLIVWEIFKWSTFALTKCHGRKNYFKRSPSGIEFLIVGFFFASLVEVIHSPDPLHLWWAFPLTLILIAPGVAPKVDSWNSIVNSNLLSMLSSLIVAAGLFGAAMNYGQQRETLTTDSVLSGMKVRSETRSAWESNLESLNGVRGVSRQVDYRCVEPIFAVTWGDYLPSQAEYIPWMVGYEESSAKPTVQCSTEMGNEMIVWTYGGYHLPAFSVRVEK